MHTAKFLIEFGVHMIILLIIKVKIVFHVEWSYRSPN